ncbi:hypothetical protein MtrunA17_Chr1g0164711 [Medicago truncatula]|uniref:Uncharacterized protein n=1 Tax=Medicago truncatula TaxID=3880 RepID=A0A396JUK8_MEDTR|nr:hypothetical protein MtrunA17_Chr1g0164711 [Medicago truncatula]
MGTVGHGYAELFLFYGSPKRAIFVDEIKFVGYFTEKTFTIESVYGRAKIVSQWIDSKHKIDPTCIQALEGRASILETIRCYQDFLHDLVHLKLLYNTILHDRKLAGLLWKRHNARYNEIPRKLFTLTAKIQQLKQKLSCGETHNVDYYGLISLRRGCTRLKLQRAHFSLSLKHKPEKATGFIERCELANDGGGGL